jgi:hypothetical protein
MQILKTNLHIVHGAVAEAHSGDAKTSKANMFTEAQALSSVLFGSNPPPPQLSFACIWHWQSEPA